MRSNYGKSLQNYTKEMKEHACRKERIFETGEWNHKKALGILAEQEANKLK